MGYDTVLFDWDGCLAKTLEVWVDVYTCAFQPYGIYLKDDEIITIAGDWSAIKALGVSNVLAFRRDINERVTTRLPQAALYPGAKPALASLKHHGIHLGLVTSSERADIYRALTFHDLEEVFDSVVCGDDVQKHKPHPESIEMAMDSMHASAGSTIMVGDSAKDILAAANANIASILTFHNSHDKYYSLKVLEECMPTYIIRSFDELPSILFEITQPTLHSNL